MAYNMQNTITNIPKTPYKPPAYNQENTVYADAAWGAYSASLLQIAGVVLSAAILGRSSSCLLLSECTVAF